MYRFQGILSIRPEVKHPRGDPKYRQAGVSSAVSEADPSFCLDALGANLLAALFQEESYLFESKEKSKLSGIPFSSADA